MNRFCSWIADRLRPFHDNGLGEELQFPAIPFEKFHREDMLRSASFSTALDLATGIFQFLRPEYARRAARAWRPRELFLMEDLSLAFYLIEQQRHRGILVEPVHIDRLVEILHRYYAYVGTSRSRAEVRQEINQYLDEHSVPDPEPDPAAFCNVPVDHPLLEQLHEIDREMKERFPPRPWGAGLGDLGLFLDRELDDSRYGHATPVNCRTFARTGVDGVHFSLLVQERAITEASPVVITVPAWGAGSRIAGETLFDFLCFGSARGYSPLAGLSSDPEETLRAYTDSAWKATESWHESNFHIDDQDRQMLAFLTARLGLRPWADAARFHQLQEKYQPLLKLPPDALR